MGTRTVTLFRKIPQTKHRTVIQPAFQHYHFRIKSTHSRFGVPHLKESFETGGKPFVVTRVGRPARPGWDRLAQQHKGDQERNQKSGSERTPRVNKNLATSRPRTGALENDHVAGGRPVSCWLARTANVMPIAIRNAAH